MRTMTSDDAKKTVCPHFGMHPTPPLTGTQGGNGDPSAAFVSHPCLGEACQLWEQVDGKPQFGYCGMRAQNRTNR